MNGITYVAHSPVGPRGQLCWDSWRDLFAAIAATRWDGLITVYADTEALVGKVTGRYVEGRLTGDLLVNTLRMRGTPEPAPMFEVVAEFYVDAD